MKTKITTVFFGLITSISFGQMTLVKTLKNIENHYFPDSRITSFQNGDFEISMFSLKELISGNKIVSFDGGVNYIIYDSEFNIQNQFTLDTVGSIDWSVSSEYKPKYLISDHIYNTDDKIEIMYFYYLRGGGTVFKIINEDGILLYSETKSVDWGYNCTLGEKKEGNDFELALYKFGDKPYLIKKIQNLECKQNPYYQDEYIRFFPVSEDIQLYKLGGELPCRYMCNSNSTTNKSAELPSYDVNIYPNPTSSLLNIEIPINLEVTKCEIYDGKGALLSSSFVNGGVNNVDVSQLTSGTYVCTLYNDQEFVHSEVFIKQ